MAATLTWLDHDADEHDRMHRILSLFKERDTRDELGVGSIRDLIADRLFPGTSTIQTRLRYVFFVPWLYQGLEAVECPSAKFAREARKREVALVAGLLGSDDTAGVFGKRAGGALERLPSSVYWSGLGAWGLRRFNGSQEQYHQWIDEVYRARRERGRRQRDADRRGEGADAVGPLNGVTWHPKLPEPPRGFPERASVRLTAAEAHFLQDQVVSTEGASLLAKLMFLPPADVEFPWQHPRQAEFAEEHRQILYHARLFSDLIYGAALLYVLMLAEQVRNDEWITRHREAGRRWSEELDRGALRGWSFNWVFPLAAEAQRVVPPRTLRFCSDWLTLALEKGADVFDHVPARGLVRGRETQLKGHRSRFTNPRALDQWSGQGGLFRLNYRWPTVRQLLKDLHEGLSPDADHDEVVPDDEASE